MCPPKQKGGLLVALTVDDAAKQPGGRIYGVAAPPAADAAWTPVADLDAFACDVLNKNIHPKLDDDASPPMVLNDAAVDARGRVWIGCKLLSPRRRPEHRDNPPARSSAASRRFRFAAAPSSPWAPRKSCPRSGACTPVTASDGARTVPRCTT